MTSDASTARRGSAFDLSAYLTSERRHVELALSRAVEAWRDELPEETWAAVHHGVTSGGKRLRPILCATAYRACGGAAGGDALYDLAVSLELVHAYSLMHDDLPCMDDAELRRGRPTTHREHGVERTIVAGAALIPMAAHRALTGARRMGCPEEHAREVARELCRAAGAGGMVGGQALDLLGEDRRLASHELDRLHRHKTGALLTAALRMGAVAAGAPGRHREALDVYGRAVGLAFQIADDVLDATASAADLGKKPSDQDLHKSTYVSLHGLDEARRRGREEVSRARSALEAADLDAPALHALARYVVERRR